VLTADKASIRVNIVLKYRVDDPVLATQAVVDLAAGLYSEAQLVYRRHVAGQTIEPLLERRGEASEIMRTALAGRARGWGVEVLQLDLKDIVLPGEMKALFNRVIEADKQAQAQNILRREEVASTRSLANTAKLLESNPTLLRLKEMENWKEMAAKVGQVTVVVSPQQLSDQIGLKLPGVTSLPDSTRDAHTARTVRTRSLTARTARRRGCGRCRRRTRPRGASRPAGSPSGRT
jgi:regulator of protease activity HflC (stomatin/prohibitin superfamily)